LQLIRSDPGHFASGESSVLGGGLDNTVSGESSVIGGGVGNIASGYSSVVGGGSSNTASGSWSSVAGGTNNTVSGQNAFVGGGAQNVASGDYAIALGASAQATHANCFVWNSGVRDMFSSAADGEFAAQGTAFRFFADNGFTAHAGGFDFVVNPASGSGFNFSGKTFSVQAGTSFTVTTGPRSLQFGTTGMSVNAALTLNGNLNCTSTDPAFFAGTVTATGFSTSSDRNLKENFAPIDQREVLARVAALPIQSWSFKENARIRHIGPMAQDFYAAFQVGADDRHIMTVDEDGVALAAIQGLDEMVREKEAEIDALKKQMVMMQREIETLEKARAHKTRVSRP
jgi:hypothetical protein